MTKKHPVPPYKDAKLGRRRTSAARSSAQGWLRRRWGRCDAPEQGGEQLKMLPASSDDDSDEPSPDLGTHAAGPSGARSLPLASPTRPPGMATHTTRRPTLPSSRIPGTQALLPARRARLRPTVRLVRVGPTRVRPPLAPSPSRRPSRAAPAQLSRYVAKKPPSARRCGGSFKTRKTRGVANKDKGRCGRVFSPWHVRLGLE